MIPFEVPIIILNFHLPSVVALCFPVCHCGSSASIGVLVSVGPSLWVACCCGSPFMATSPPFHLTTFLPFCI